MEYLLKTCGIVIIFYVFYLVFLKKETFFKWNRLFLIGGLVLAVILSGIIIPVYVEYTPIDTSNFVLEASENNNTNPSLGTAEILVLLYFSGVVCFLVHFIFQFFSLMTIIWNSKQKRIGKYIYVETKKHVLPFSFFNWIVYNPNGFNNPELEQILTHERMHADQYHSIDVLLSQLFCILLWFNPFVWLYTKTLKQNLEFLADHSAIKQSKCKTSYQYTLLKASVPTYQLVLSNNFYNSLIKKRIVMLHKSQSKKTNQLKFLLIAPVLAVFLMSFNTKTVYVEKEIPVKELMVPQIPMVIENTPKFENTPNDTNINEEKTNAPVMLKKQNIKNQDVFNDFIMVGVNKKSTDAELDDIIDMLKEYGVEISFMGIKRNKKGEITAIKINANSKISNANFNVSSNDPIKLITIRFNKKDNSITIGNTVSKNQGDGAPIYIVDGKEEKKAKLNDLNPNDIELLYVLKGTAATEKYGDKGKNGVVEIITKKQE